MADRVAIRETALAELEQVLALYPLAFPDEELRPVVSGLIEGGAEVLSLGAFAGYALVGHVLFTLFGDDRAGALRGPLGVLPAHQGEGIGSALVRDGLARLEALGVGQVFVLGDPAYYGRFGFRPEREVLPPYALPAEWRDAWQSMVISGRARLAPGRCRLPEVWMEPALWAP